MAVSSSEMSHNTDACNEYLNTCVWMLLKQYLFKKLVIGIYLATHMSVPVIQPVSVELFHSQQ